MRVHCCLSIPLVSKLINESKTSSSINEAEIEIEEIAQRILLELESANSTDLSDATYAKMILRLSDDNYTMRLIRQVESAGSEVNAEISKRAIIKVLLLSTWLQRLYFIIRSFLMALISATITTMFILYFGTIDVFKGFLIGVFVFLFGLVLTRLFEVQITKATKKIVVLMSSHKKARNFIMNYF
jgi:hypothetical protein